MSARQDIVVYGTTPWDSPWLTEQNLASALAERHRVLYVEPPQTPLAPFRYGVGADTPAQLRRLLRRSLRQDGAVHVLRPLAIPPREHPRARSASLPLVRRQISRAVATLRFDAPIVIAAHSVHEWLGAAGEAVSVYLAKDLVEAGSALIGKDARTLADNQRRMCEAVDIVCAVTSRLQSTLRERGIDAELLLHGFAGDLAPVYDAAPVPAELRRLPRPLIGYTGRIDGRLDFDAVAGVARRFSHGSVVLVGPVSPRLDAQELEKVRQLDNVHFLGAKGRDELPGYVRHLDCCLMPYRDDEWLRHGSPLKLWDYLYAGPTVVGSGCAALLDYPLVRYASPPSRLAQVVEDALTEPDREDASRRDLALANTWAHRAQQLIELVGRRPVARGGADAPLGSAVAE